MTFVLYELVMMGGERVKYSKIDVCNVWTIPMACDCLLLALKVRSNKLDYVRYVHCHCCVVLLVISLLTDLHPHQKVRLGLKNVFN